MAEPAAAAPEATPAAQPAAPQTETERATAALEKGKAAVAAKNAEATGTEEPDAPSAEGEEKPDETVEAKPDEEPKEGEAEAEAKDEPKTARAKEWAKINRIKQAQATRDRTIARREEELTRNLAEFTKIQERYADLERMRREDPKAFVEQFGQGGVRALFEAAVQQEKRTPEEEEKLSLKKELDELKAWRKKQEEDSERSKREQEEQNRTRQTAEWHSQNFTATQRVITEIASEGGYPNVAALIRTTYGLRSVSGDVYNRILAEWNDGKGRERPIPEVLDVIESELAKEAGSGLPQASPPARATGAVETAKPEAKPKRTPPTMTNAQASARASAGRELKGDERVKHFASLLRTRHD